MFDSLVFLPMVLTALPKSFSLSDLKKVDVPYLYNIEDVQNSRSKNICHTYQSSLICRGPHECWPKRNFMQWYEMSKDQFLNFYQELL